MRKGIVMNGFIYRLDFFEDKICQGIINEEIGQEEK